MIHHIGVAQQRFLGSKILMIHIIGLKPFEASLAMTELVVPNRYNSKIKYLILIS